MNFVQISSKYCANIMQTYICPNKLKENHKILIKAKCYPITHSLYEIPLH